MKPHLAASMQNSGIDGPREPLTYDGGTFAPDLPHRGPDDTPCEIASCVRPAEEVLIIRGRYRVRCIPHANELRRQGAQQTDLSPEAVPTPTPTPTPAPRPFNPLPPSRPMPVDAPRLCAWPSCHNPSVSGRFCPRDKARVLTLKGTISGQTDADLAELPKLWADHTIAATEKRRVLKSSVATEPAEPFAGSLDTPKEPPSPAAPARDTFRPALRRALGMGSDATDDEIIEEAKTLTNTLPDLRTVRADRDKALGIVVQLRAERDESERLYGESVKAGQELMQQLTSARKVIGETMEALSGGDEVTPETLAVGVGMLGEMMARHADKRGIAEREVMALTNERDTLLIRLETAEIIQSRLKSAEAELYAVDVVLHLDGEGVTRHDGDRAETIGQIIDDRDEMRAEGDEITRATGAPVGERVRYVRGFVEQLANIERERDTTRENLATMDEACARLTRERDEARQHLDKANAQIVCDLRPAPESCLSARDRKVAGKLIEAIAKADECVVDEVADALRVLLGCEA